MPLSDTSYSISSQLCWRLSNVLEALHIVRAVDPLDQSGFVDIIFIYFLIQIVKHFIKTLKYLQLKVPIWFVMLRLHLFVSVKDIGQNLIKPSLSSKKRIK